MGSSDGAPSPYNADAGNTTRKANAEEPRPLVVVPVLAGATGAGEEGGAARRRAPTTWWSLAPGTSTSRPSRRTSSTTRAEHAWTNGWTTVADGTSTKVAEAAAGAGKKGKKANNSSSKAPSSSSVHREDSQRMGCDAMLQLSQMRPDFFRGPGGPDNPYEPWQYDPQPVARAARR